MIKALLAFLITLLAVFLLVALVMGIGIFVAGVRTGVTSVRTWFSRAWSVVGWAVAIAIVAGIGYGVYSLLPTTSQQPKRTMAAPAPMPVPRREPVWETLHVQPWGDSAHIDLPAGCTPHFVGSGLRAFCVYTDSSVDEFDDVKGCRPGPMLFAYARDTTGKANMFRSKPVCK